MLTAAGMLSEAKEAVDRALSTFAAQRTEAELVDALLASGELALLRGDQIMAKRQARKAERISDRRHHRTAALLARLLALRADAAVAFDPVRSTRITPPTRSTCRAAAAEATGLADSLDDAGLTEDARTAQLRARRCSVDARRRQWCQGGRRAGRRGQWETESGHPAG